MTDLSLPEARERLGRVFGPETFFINLTVQCREERNYIITWRVSSYGDKRIDHTAPTLASVVSFAEDKFGATAPQTIDEAQSAVAEMAGVA